MEELIEDGDDDFFDAATFDFLGGETVTSSLLLLLESDSLYLDDANFSPSLFLLGERLERKILLVWTVDAKQTVGSIEDTDDDFFDDATFKVFGGESIYYCYKVIRDNWMMAISLYHSFDWKNGLSN